MVLRLPISLSVSKNYLFFVRHGQRADNKGGSFHSDSEITENGKSQAKASGELFKDLVSRHPTKNIKILSSPWTRCMMTASYIAEQLDHKELIVEPKMCETLLDLVFKENPFNYLNILDMNKSDYKQKFLAGNVDVKQASESSYENSKNWYPESVEHYYKRCYDYIQNHGHFVQDEAESSIAIVVTHALALDAIREFTNNEKPIIDYCSISCIEEDKTDPNQRTLLLNAFSDHIDRGDDYILDPLKQVFVL